MDPTKALEDIRKYEVNGDLGQLAQSFSDLDAWLVNGGFLPVQWQVAAPRPGRPRRQEDGEVLEGVPHGKRRSYNLGCQCVACTSANRLRRNLTPAELEELQS